MSGHHLVGQLRTDIETAVATSLGAADDAAAVMELRERIGFAFHSYCPNVPLVRDSEIEVIAKLCYVKIIEARKVAHPDMIVIPWEEEADVLKDSWRDAIRRTLALGDVPPNTAMA